MSRFLEKGLEISEAIANGAMTEGYGVTLDATTPGEVAPPGATDGSVMCAGVVYADALDTATVKIKNHEPGGCMLVRAFAAVATPGLLLVMEASDGRFKGAAFATNNAADDVLLYAHGWSVGTAAAQDDLFLARIENLPIACASL